MPLGPGTRLGPCEILSAIGAVVWEVYPVFRVKRGRCPCGAIQARATAAVICR